MKVRVYQIDESRDKDGVIFRSTAALEEMYEFVKVDKAIYKEVYCGELAPCSELEEIYFLLNSTDEKRPKNYKGRSMCVSDLVEVMDESYETEPGLYYCDSIGFKKVKFCTKEDLELHKKITVLMIEPGKEAEIRTIGTGLKALQNAVGGYIETYYPFSDTAVLVCNDEGKLNGMKPNRGIYDSDGKLMDIIFGPFFICNAPRPEFESLTEEQAEKYMTLFKEPESLSRCNGAYTMTKLREKVS